MTSTKSYDYKKNTISRLFAIQALFQMEANGKRYSTIKKELRETFYTQQIHGAEILRPNYLLSQRIIEQAAKNQIKIDTKINMAFNNLWNLKRIDSTLRAILRAASAEFLNKKTPKKVILSESVVEACREMKCPYPLQANQISQCNDFGALLPVITFLCDAVIKWRMLTGDTTRIYSEMEFSSKGYTFPEENYNLEKSFLDKVLNRYTPNRVMRYSQDNWTGSREEEEARVQSCLLEYGEKFKRKKYTSLDNAKRNASTMNNVGGIVQTKQDVFRLRKNKKPRYKKGHTSWIKDYFNHINK